MMISTKGRYALRVLTDLAEHRSDTYIPLKNIAERQDISQKYLESIMSMLSRAGFVEGVHGKGGGYKLSRDPADYKVGDILRVTEGSLAPVACLEDDAEPCEKASNCRTLKMWQKLYTMINTFFNDISIEDLMNNADIGDDYVI